MMCASVTTNETTNEGLSSTMGHSVTILNSKPKEDLLHRHENKREGPKSHKMRGTRALINDSFLLAENNHCMVSNAWMACETHPFSGCAADELWAAYVCVSIGKQTRTINGRRHRNAYHCWREIASMRVTRGVISTLIGTHLSTTLRCNDRSYESQTLLKSIPLVHLNWFKSQKK